MKAKNWEPARAAATKALGIETRRCIAARREKAVGKEDSPSLSIGGTIEGLLEAARLKGG